MTKITPKIATKAQNKYKIVTVAAWLLSNCSFFTIIALFWSKGRLRDSVFIGTQLLPSSLNCRPLADAWEMIDCLSWIEFSWGILDEILTPSNICLYNVT